MLSRTLSYVNKYMLENKPCFFAEDQSANIAIFLKHIP